MPPTTALTITRADFTDPALAEFLQAHLDDMEPTAPPESRHALDLGALQAPGVRLWVARDVGSGDPTGHAVLGTAALAAVEPGHEEVKSMRTAPQARGRGVATALLSHLLEDATGRGVVRLSLETGSMDFFAPARALYARSGFEPCGPFGSYVEDPNSVFMTRRLPAAGR